MVTKTWTQAMIDAVDTALKEVPDGGISTVKCPICGSYIQVDVYDASRGIHCQTDGCLEEILRGV